MRGGIVAVDAAAEHGDRDPARLEGAAMGLGVDAPCHPADDDETVRRELAAEAPCHLPTVRRARPRADDGHRRPREQLELGGPAQEEPRRRVVNRMQERREARLGAAEEAQPGRPEPVALGRLVERLAEAREADGARLLHDVRVRRRCERGERELVHAASSFGER